MAQTKSGVLHLGKKEIEALKVIQRHIRQDISYNGGGTFSNGETDSFGGYDVDTKEVLRTKKGLEVIDFILQITE